MKKLLTLFLWVGILAPAEAQRILSLDSCRALALRNNKQLNVSKLKQQVAANIKKAARTKYLPKVDALGGYEYTSREVSLLNKDQKSALGNLGTTVTAGVGGNLTNLATTLVQQGVISPAVAQQLSGVLGQLSPALAQMGNQLGSSIRDAFETNTHNIFAGAVMVRQPLYMGGAIVAANNMARISEQLALNNTDVVTQSTLYNIDQAYWTVVSLRQKHKLAKSYHELVSKLDSDVHKMIKAGVATKADGLKVDVRENEADMQVMQVEDGLSLAKMLLCQLCGIPLDEEIVLADEGKESLSVDEFAPTMEKEQLDQSRPELRMLQNSIDLSKEATKVIRAAYLPQVLLTGGYLISNPNVFNGFENKFSGMWTLGVMVRVPVWNWFEGSYKVRASRIATDMATLELSDARDKIGLQVAQSQFRVKEAQKKLNMARKNIKSAEENLRCANLGFKEGVMESTDVMAAQTAWQQAQSQKIDAEVDVKLTLVNLKKALGILQ
ncbi:outer membrane efflux protein [Prevotella sp. DNF00663]|uniref:TolC family protein n=1 Tax=unclassified Prevotella TaxID=2638335 RepID=UPI000513D9F8|nr:MULTISPECIES: TolC family protein [unclassified Prevotella]KGI60622.1 alkaline protease [Prevotella sp. S7 MS 2]KXB84681.1 outer membrane efflux protein [Prevotella sp. DNF00663]